MAVSVVKNEWVYETIVLSNKSRDLILSALDTPPAPNQALRNLMK